MHEFLATVPFDLYELHLLQLVAVHRSFTKAAKAAGLTQSALTRQIQGIERRLGVALLERSTRHVQPTPAGEFLLAESTGIIGAVRTTLRRVREEFSSAPKEVRVGVSRSVSLAYLPGFLHANLRANPQVVSRVSYRAGRELLLALEAGELDVAVLATPNRLPKNLTVTHRFADAFTMIAPPGSSAAYRALKKPKRGEWLARQPWLLLESGSSTGAALRKWLSEQSVAVEPVMEMDGFDAIINLVALGMGCSLVPIRALALYGKRRAVDRLAWPERFTREIVVLTRKQRQTPAHLLEFVSRILF